MLLYRNAYHKKRCYVCIMCCLLFGWRYKTLCAKPFKAALGCYVFSLFRCFDFSFTFSSQPPLLSSCALETNLPNGCQSNASVSFTTRKHTTFILLTLATHCICSGLLSVCLFVCVSVWVCFGGLSNKLPPFPLTTSEQQTTVHQYF